MGTKTPRWIDLVAFLLQHRFAVTREEIFKHVGGYDGAEETARRKFERDKDELRDLGIEIETVTLPDAAGDEPAMGYRLKPRSAYLPYLELADEPAPSKPYPGLDRIVLSRAELEMLDRATRALADSGDSPLADAAASARRKLAFDLPLSQRSLEQILAYPLPAHARRSLAVLQEALIDRVAVSCRYFTMSRGVEAERELEPWGLLFQWGRWFCVARARDRDEPRLFRVDRMCDARKLKGPQSGFTVPDDFDVREFAGRLPWEYGTGDPMRTAVRFAFPESRSIINRGVGQLVRQESDNAAILEFELRDQDAFLRWLLSFGRRAEVLEPSSLAESLAGLRADVAALYAESGP